MHLVTATSFLQSSNRNNLMSETPAPSAQPQATKPKQDLNATVRTLQFAWFVGHVITVVSSLLLLLSTVGLFRRSARFWYKAALVGVVESFGVLNYQLVKKNGANIKVLLRDDNVQYFFLGVALLVLRPYVLLTLSTFFLFSVFHVLLYTKHFLLPALDMENSPLSTKIGNFVTANNNQLIQLASLLELYTLAWLLVRTLSFRKRSLSPLLVYIVFIKLRFEKSAFTRRYFKLFELRVEDAVNGFGNPAVKDLWVKVKAFFHKVGAVLIVHDHTKEKAQ